MNQRTTKRDALTRNELTGFVSEVMLPVNGEQLEGVRALRAEAEQRRNTSLALIYEYVEEKMRHAAGTGQENCEVRYGNFAASSQREGVDENQMKKAWQLFCRPFVA